MIWHAADRQASAAKAFRSAIRRLRRQPVPGIPHAIFPRGGGLGVTPLLKIGIGSMGQEQLPSFVELGAGMVEGGGRAMGLLSWMAARIESTSPAPRILSKGDADPLGDRADADIAIIDVPAFVLGIGSRRRVRAGMAHDSANRASREAATDWGWG